jgi:hypothetical protein
MWPPDGPEGDPDVLVFMNGALTESLEKGCESHPVGSVAVKEHFVTGDDQVMMWTVMVKTDAVSGDGEGWVWVMGTADGVMQPPDPIEMCANCHSGGVDFVTTSFPFEH